MHFIYLCGHYGATEQGKAGREAGANADGREQLGEAVNREANTFLGSQDVWECICQGGNSGAK